MEIGIIDTGISLGYFDNVDSLKSRVSFTNDNGIKKDFVADRILTHGTICASIICKYANNPGIHSLNVMNNGIGTPEMIAQALYYCLEHNIQLINISLGLNLYKSSDILEKAVKKAAENQCIIVAATSTTGIITYPAHYGDVISVGVNKHLHLKKNEYFINDDSVLSANIYACGIQRLYKNCKMILITQNEPSYSTSVITAEVYNILNIKTAIPSKNEIIALLCQKQQKG